MPEAYVDLDTKQLDLLNRKMQQVSNDPLFMDEQPLPINTRMPIQAPHTAPPQTILSPDSAFVTERKTDEIKARIAKIERELGDGASLSAPESDMTYRDSSGNETFYAKNICGKHFVLSDIQIDKIPVGKSVDLLQMASMEDLKKSRDLRKALRGIGSERTLQRLTEREYLEEKTRELDNKKRLNIVQQQEQLRRLQQPSQDQQQQTLPHERSFDPSLMSTGIRPAIEARLGKLSLRSDKDPENRRQAMSSYEFISWVQQERFTHAEIEQIMSHPSVVNDHDIRASLLEKKRATPSE